MKQLVSSSSSSSSSSISTCSAPMIDYYADADAVATAAVVVFNNNKYRTIIICFVAVTVVVLVAVAVMEAFVGGHGNGRWCSWRWRSLLSSSPWPKFATAASAAKNNDDGGGKPPRLYNYFNSKHHTNNTTSSSSTTSTSSPSTAIPFIVWYDPNWKMLTKSMDLYEKERHNVLETLSRQLQLALSTEEEMVLHDSRRKRRYNNRHHHHHYQSSSLLYYKLPSQHLRERITKLSELYRNDVQILRDRIIKPFPFIKALPSASATAVAAASSACYNNNNEGEVDNDDSSASSDEKTPISESDGEEDDKTSFVFQYTVRQQQQQWNIVADEDNKVESASYDSIGQMVAHLVRDWSVHGKTIRQSIYSWFVNELRGSHQNNNNIQSVMVPGAGLGRLAYELATTTKAAGNGNGTTTNYNYYNVHAIELSLTLASAAYYCLTTTTNASVKLHPYANDYFTNEVNSNQRYEQVTVPDIFPSSVLTTTMGGGGESNNNSNKLQQQQRGGQLSYTIGDFVKVANASADNKVYYDAVVTCFFIDTATNVYEYIDAIYNILEPGGIWLNVGPLQWHFNSLLQLSVNELQDLLLSFGFVILKWTVDTEPVEYRNEMLYNQQQPNDNSHKKSPPPRSTHYDAYCPLRFVVRKPPNNRGSGK